MQRLRVLIVLAGLVVSGLAVGAPSAAVEASSATGQRHQPPQLRREGRWLVDPQGRVVIVHGLNLVYKRKPYVPAERGRPGSRSGTPPGWRGTASTPPGSARCGPGSRPTARRRPTRRTWTSGSGCSTCWPGSGSGSSSTCTRTSGTRQYGGEGVPDWAAARQPPFSLSAAGGGAVPDRLLDARGLDDVRRLLGQPPTACSTAGWRPGGSPRSGGSTSRT